MELEAGLVASGMLTSGLGILEVMGRIEGLKELEVGGGRLLGRDRHRLDGSEVVVCVVLGCCVMRYVDSIGYCSK